MSKNEVSVKSEKKPVKQVKVSVESSLIVGNAFKSFEKKSNDIIIECKKVTKVSNDIENTQTRNIAKAASELCSVVNKSRLALNKPLKETIDRNNAESKVILDAVDIEITRLKALIQVYELDKERKRQEELRKAEAIRLAKEEEERKERERISSIRTLIDEKQTNYNRKIHSCNTLQELLSIESEIKEISVSKKDYDVLTDNMKQVKTILLNQIKERRVVVEQLEKASASAKKQIIADFKEKEAEKIQSRTIEEQAMDSISQQQLISIVQSLKTKESDWKLEDKINELYETYGSYSEALKNINTIIEREKEKIAAITNISQLEDDKVKNQRKEVKFRIIDESNIPREYLKVDEAKIRAVMGEKRAELKDNINSFKINGVEFYIESLTVLK